MKNFLTDIVGVSPSSIADSALESQMAKSKFTATSLTPPDTAPTFDDDGYTHMRPDFDEADMLEALESPSPDNEDSRLSPQQSYEAMKYQAPLSEEERNTLNDTPFIGPDLTWVDDPDHEQWIDDLSKDKYKAIDNVLDDQMYGDDDLGFSLNPMHYAKKALHGVEHVASAAEKGALAGLKNVGKMTKVVATWPAKKLEGIAKMVASAAAFPIKKAVRPLVMSTANLVAKKNGRAVPSAADKQQASKIAISTLIKNPNPLAKFGGVVLKWVGTGVSGDATVVGMTGVEVAVLAGATAAAIALVMGKLKSSAAQTVGVTQAAPGGIDPATGLAIDPATGMPVDPTTGQPMDPATAQQYAAQYQAQQQQGGPAQQPPAYDPSMQAAQPTYDPNAVAPAAYDPNASAYDPNAAAAYDPSTDPNAYTSGDAMSKDENLDTLIFGDDVLVYGEGPAEGLDTLVYGDDGKPDYDFMVGANGKKFVGFADEILGGKSKPIRSISAKTFKELTIKRAQTTSGNATPDVKHLVKAHSVLGKKLQAKRIVVRPPAGTPAGTTSGAWLYKLNPLYWTKTAEERGFIDQEKANYEKTKELNKKAGKREKVLDAARRAEYQAEQAHAAQAQAESIDTELKDIQESISSGVINSSSMGAVPASAKIFAILGAAASQGRVDAQNTAKQCGALADKIEAGQKLTPDELNQLRGCLKMCGHLKKLHDQLHAKMSGMGYHDDKAVTSPFLGEDVQEILGAHKASSEEMMEIMGAHKASSEEMMEVMGEDVQEILGAAFVGTNSGPNDILGGSPPTQSQLIALTAVAATQPSKLPALIKQEGITMSKSDMAKLRVATARAKIIMSHPDYGKMKLSKSALSKLSGDSESGDDSMGGIFGTLGKILTAPLAAGAVAASALSWGVKHVVVAPLGLLGKVNAWGAKKGGWGTLPGYGSSSPSTPAGTVAPTTAALTPANMPPGMPPLPPPPAGVDPQVAAAMQQRQIAAYQRIQAANAQDQAAQQQLAASAAAADAEAQALEAEAQAQSDQQAATQAQYGIPPGGDDSMGADGVLKPEWFSGYDVEPIPHKIDMSKKAQKITAEAQKNTATGKKIRAGATLYHKAKKGDPKSRLAIKRMQEKAAKGDPQAKRDVNAVKAGKIAVHTKGRALRTIARKSRAEALKKRFAADQRKLEKGAAQRLSEHSRRKRLVKIAKVERRAAGGDKKARAAIVHHVKLAKAGDKKSQANVAALKLARHVRLSARTPQDAKRQKQAGKLVRNARHGNKKAIRQLALIQHAAKAGQPNAKRAMKHLQVASHVERTVSTGKVSLPTSKNAKQALVRAQVSKQHKNDIVRYDMLKKRVAGPMGTREEALAAAKLGQKLGMKQEATALMMRARTLRSAKQPIKDKAVLVASAKGGSKQAQAQLSDELASAQRGEPRGIAEAGKTAGVMAVASVQKGEPMPKPIAEATKIVERAQAGDPEAKRIVARVGEAAQNPAHPDHAAAVETAVALTAASAVLAATASNAAAHAHWKAEARKATGTHVEPDERGKVKEELDAKVAKLKSGEGTYSDGVKAREMAMALGMTPLAAQISAIMPPADTGNPMSSLPDKPLRPITGWRSFISESLKALTLSTPDPFENYHEGSLSRGSTPMLRAMGPTMKASSAAGHAFVGHAFVGGASGVTVYTVRRASEGDVASKKKLFNLLLSARKGDRGAVAERDDVEAQAKVALAAGQLDKDKMAALKQEINEFLSSVPALTNEELEPAKV